MKIQNSRFAILRALGLASALAMLSVSPVRADDLADVAKLLKAGKVPEALGKTNEYLAKHPADPQMRFMKGVLLSEQNRNDEAIVIFTKLTEDYRDLPEPYNNLAVLYAAGGNYEKARIALEKAIRTNPSYMTAYENLGDVYGKMASQAYDKALALGASTPPAKTKLTMLRTFSTTTGAKVVTPELLAQATAPAAAPVRTSASNQVQLITPLPATAEKPNQLQRIPALSVAPPGNKPEAPKLAAAPAAAPGALAKAVVPPVAPAPAGAALKPAAPAQVAAKVEPAKPAVPAPVIVMAKAEPAKVTAAPVPSGPSKAELAKAEALKAEAAKAELAKAEAAKAELAKADAAKAAATKLAAAQAAKLDAVKAEAAKAEAAKAAALAKAETAKSAKAKSDGGDREAVIKQVHGWAKAWTAQNVDSYLGYYSNDFDPPKGLSRKAWAEERRSRIEGKGRIKVEVGDPDVVLTGNTAKVTFRQTYISDRLNAKSRKTLILVNNGGKWQIKQESSGS
ncbi:tetratricopeptide repeat protein [Oxalobacteraceae bacterium]|nr:tetratricopeptide repeat protein [Oxalobacteraceae bacterium]